MPPGTQSASAKICLWQVQAVIHQRKEKSNPTAKSTLCPDRLKCAQQHASGTKRIHLVVQMYKAGALDYAAVGLALEGQDRIRHTVAGEYVAQPRASTGFLGFPVGREPFDDPRLRRAFAHATDREALPDVRLGFSFLPWGGSSHPGFPWASNITLPYDPNRARQFLAEAGYPGGEGFPQVEWLTTPRGRARPKTYRPNGGSPGTGDSVAGDPLADYFDMFARVRIRRPLPPLLGG